MEELNDDRKKEEEEYGGFEPEDSEEDSFILDEDSDYPSKLPSNFSDEDDSEPISEDEANVSDEEEETDQVGEEELEENQEDEEPETESEEEDIEDETSEEEAEETSDEEVSEVAEPEGEETVVMDDDFKKELQKDLDESKKARQEDETQEVHDVEKGESAKSIGDDADTVVTFDKIEADKPSNYGLPPIVDRDYENVDADDVSQVNTEEIQQESDSKKKLPVWMLMLYTAAATFILTSALAIIIWQAYLNDEEEIDEQQTTEAMEEDRMIPADTLDEEGSEEDISDRELLEKFEDDTSEIESEPLVKPEILEELDKAKEKQKIEDSKDIAAKSTKVPETEKNIEPPKKQAKQPKTDTKERRFSMPQPEGPAPEKGVYTVQIYSSPSLEDAERWLVRLENKDIKSGFISKHVIKDKTWYRVRYGEFETKQEARASALEMGFSQSWIDRVK